MEQSSNAMEQAVVEILKGFIVSVEKASDFLSAEIPEVVTQLLAYKLFVSVSASLLGLILLLTALRRISVMVKAFNRKNLDREDPNYLHRDAADTIVLVNAFVGAALAIVTLLILPINFSAAAMIIIAPKVYILEYMRGLI